MIGKRLGFARPFSQDWLLPEWNGALLRHFFSAQPGDLRPISRLYVTAEELKKSAGATDVSAEQAREQFISMLQATIGTRSLGKDAEARAWRWDLESPVVPPFLAHLLFMCMIANDLSEDLRDQGDFRHRLTKALGSGTNHGLERMKALWESLSAWLLRQTASPLHCRPLELPTIPTSGPFCIIGHPIRLAFPARKDQLVLARVLSKLTELIDEIPVAEVLAIVGRYAFHFSLDFRDVFEDFRRAYLEHPNSTLYNTAFWSAILDVASKSPRRKQEGIESAAARVEAEDDDGRFTVTLTANSEIETARFKTSKMPASRISAYEYLIESKSQGGPLAASSLLFDTASRHLLADVCPRPALRSATEGFLLFERSEDGGFEYTSRLPASGELIALMQAGIAAPFRELLKSSGTAAEISASDYPGWREARGLRGEELLRVDFSSRPLLSTISCLRKTITPPRLRFLGGIKTDSGYLLSKAFMPSVEIVDATSVTAITEKGTEIPLLPLGEPAQTWKFPNDSVERFEGSLQLLAKRLDHYLTSRDIRFTNYVYSVAYKEPSDSARWLQDDGGDDLVSLPNPMAAAKTGRTKGRFVTATVQPKTLAPSASTGPKASLNEFLDALASLFVRRKGLAEQELFELVTESLQVRGRYVGTLLRSWEEQGLFDCRYNVQWRSRVYFARKPVLHSFVEAGKTILVMTGLSPTSLVRRFAETSKRLGFQKLTRLTPNDLVPTVQAVQLASDGQGALLADELQLDSPQSVARPQDLVRPLTEDLRTSGQEPLTWEVYRGWDWSLRRFVESPEDPERNEFGLVWCRRDDGPDYYKIKHAGSTRFWSRSRNSCLLHLYRLAGTPAFRNEGSTVLPDSPGLYLPTPLARFSAIVGPSAPGHSTTSEGLPGYKYTFPDVRAAEETLRSLYPNSFAPVDSGLRHFANTAPSYGGRLVPVPASFRTRLATLRSSGVSDRSLASVPERALPQLYRLLKNSTSST